MSLIKCPECGRKVSSSALSCPGCGFDVKHRHWYSKKWGIYLIIAAFAITIFMSYKFYKNTNGLVKKIDEAVQNEVIKDYKLESIKSSYEKLNFIEKLFVYNYHKLKKVKIEITSNNLKEYITIDIKYSNYRSEEQKVLFGIDKYTEYVTMNLEIKSNGKYKFENINFKLDLNNGYKVIETDDHLEVTLDEKGTYNKTVNLINDGLLNNNITSELKMPEVEINKITLKNVSGYIYYK